MRRGDIVTVAAGGAYGKPRPALVVQSDYLAGGDSVLVCLITSTLQGEGPRRLPIPTLDETGLERPSEIMVDKILSVRRDRVGRSIGRLSAAQLSQVEGKLAVVLGLADTADLRPKSA